MKKRHKLIIMVESAIIKKSLLIHRLLTAGRCGLNKRSQCHVDLGGKMLHVSLATRGCAMGPLWAPTSHLPAGHLPEKLPLPPVTHGTPAQGQYPIEGFRMLGVLTSLLSPLSLLRLVLPSLPSPSLSLFSNSLIPSQRAFCCGGPSYPAITLH